MTEKVLVACPTCHTLNRAPRDKLVPGAPGKCGSCGRALFTGHPVALTSGDFEPHAVKSDIPLLVDFWAAWCGPCKAMAPQFEKAAAQLEPAIRLAKVDTDAEQELAGRFAIRGIPTMILFRNGREIARRSGAMDSTAIAAWARRALA